MTVPVRVRKRPTGARASQKCACIHAGMGHAPRRDRIHASNHHSSPSRGSQHPSSAPITAVNGASDPANAAPSPRVGGTVVAAGWTNSAVTTAVPSGACFATISAFGGGGGGGERNDQGSSNPRSAGDGAAVRLERLRVVRGATITAQVGEGSERQRLGRANGAGGGRTGSLGRTGGLGGRTRRRLGRDRRRRRRWRHLGAGERLDGPHRCRRWCISRADTDRGWRCQWRRRHVERRRRQCGGQWPARPAAVAGRVGRRRRRRRHAAGH